SAFCPPSLFLLYFLFFSLTLPPPLSTLFPYTTLFRSPPSGHDIQKPCPHIFRPGALLSIHNRLVSQICTNGKGTHYLPPTTVLRSEEHTSELQSRFDLVCRLLLEKKKHT